MYEGPELDFPLGCRVVPVVARPLVAPTAEPDPVTVDPRAELAGYEPAPSVDVRAPGVSRLPKPAAVEPRRSAPPAPKRRAGRVVKPLSGEVVESKVGREDCLRLPAPEGPVVTVITVGAALDGAGAATGVGAATGAGAGAGAGAGG